jgi:hypothetical protein
MGSYEKLLTSILCDVTLTDAEARLIFYLATRPPGWTVIPSVAARDIKRNERHWVRPALRLLAARGLLDPVRERLEHGQFGQVTYLIRRDELIAADAPRTQTPRSEPATVKPSTAHPAETSQTPRSEPATVKPSMDHERSDRARSNDRRVRTDREVRTYETPLDQLPLIDIDAHFAAFWNAYPRKVGKRGARSVYDRALKRADPGVILAGAIRYKNDPNRQDQFTKHPSTWLNQDCWHDEPIPARTVRSPAANRLQQNDEEMRIYLAAQAAAEQDGYPPLRAIAGAVIAGVIEQ